MKKKRILLGFFALITCFTLADAQLNRIEFQEFTLDNGLHVILHQDHSTPIVAINITYHVGSKNEQPDRTGFAHFFEHLMFEGSKHVERGDFAEYVTNAGG
ncbi:MAG: insulinase family protein, partial [Bacteroidales bacterium]|nr:insulinase family protein [Bacteroidales bacterium]